MIKRILVLISLVVLLVAVAVFFSSTGLIRLGTKNVGSTSNPPKGKMITGSPEETFSGTIKAVNTGCFADGICSVTVDDKEVIVLQGFRGMGDDVKLGRIIGADSIGDIETMIGQHANVYASSVKDEFFSDSSGMKFYTLYGNNDYYIEILDIEKPVRE